MLIAEAKAAIEQAGGSVINQVVLFPDDVTPSEEVRKAIELLATEWDCSVTYCDDLDDEDDHEEE